LVITLNTANKCGTKCHNFKQSVTEEQSCKWSAIVHLGFRIAYSLFPVVNWKDFLLHMKRTANGCSAVCVRL